ncbi:MAG: CCA tRNA nucleotidyltransferase [Campylobacterales bacterium]|nr:CCA tRNA nucleotidyltransferase [Campylobacterales bacterium]
MIDYPNNLNNIFDKLNEFNIKPIIVGGYIRDKLLQIDSKDIDIELYGLDSLDDLETILKNFGSLNTVGKSFGVCKLNYETYDIDFSLPRKDSKIENGHRGFKVHTNKNLDFKTAASRRDFTINAMGYDVINKILLDPFEGQKDLDNKILRAVDIHKFEEDPLRVLRGVGFSTRFSLRYDEKLFKKCKEMIAAKKLEELPSERIFEELKKIFLKSLKPSLAIVTLQQLGAFSFFNELNSLTNNKLSKVLQSLDTLQKETADEKEKLLLSLALICKDLPKNERTSFLAKLTQETKIIKSVDILISCFQTTSIDLLDDHGLYSLAKKIEIRQFLLFALLSCPEEKTKTIKMLVNRAEELGILYSAMPALVEGKDLIALGLQPSKEFKIILDKTYEAQMRNLFSTKDEALNWLKINMLQLS